jgi:peptidyl-prolyl cis-trans isomerase D
MQNTAQKDGCAPRALRRFRPTSPLPDAIANLASNTFRPMISWIQRYFQHHFKTIFAVLLAVTIISFIFTIGASPGIGRGDRQYVERPFFGYNLASAADQQRMMGDASLSANLQFGALGGIDEEQVKQYALQRAASLYLADQWHIPPATPAEIKEAVTKLRMFSGPNGEFDAKAYDTFRANLKTNPRGVTEGDIARVLGNDIRADKVNKLLAGPGYVLPRDVKTQLERADTTWTLATATAEYATFKPEIKPTEAELTKFFTDSSFRYEIPPRVVAGYVEFRSADFLPAVKITDAEVRAFYDANPARFPKPPEVKPADPKTPTPPKPANPEADFAAVRTQVEATLKLEDAQKLAVKAASSLAVAMYEAKVNSTPAVQAFLTARKLQEKPLAPFTREAGPAELGHSPELAAAAFNLNKDRIVSDALPSPTGAVVLLWQELQPARTPLFAEVREKVTADYIENEKRKRFVEVGKAAKAQIAARLKAGDSFEKAVASAAAASGVKFDVKTLAPFALRTRPQDVDYSVIGALDRLNKGEVSDMILNADKGILVYAQDKKLPDLTESNPRYAETRTQLATYAATLDSRAYISEMVDRELKRTEPKPEYVRPAAGPARSSAHDAVGANAVLAPRRFGQNRAGSVKTAPCELSFRLRPCPLARGPVSRAAGADAPLRVGPCIPAPAGNSSQLSAPVSVSRASSPVLMSSRGSS